LYGDATVELIHTKEWHEMVRRGDSMIPFLREKLESHIVGESDLDHFASRAIAYTIVWIKGWEDDPDLLQPDNQTYSEKILKKIQQE